MDNEIDIVKIDFLFEAGSALQTKRLQTKSAIKLLTAGTRKHSAAEIAEYVDRRGIVVEQNYDTVSASMTVYCLSRHVDEFIPLLFEMITEPQVPQDEFDVFVARNRSSLLVKEQQTSFLARKAYYKALFGQDHPLADFASAADFDRLCRDDVIGFQRDYLNLSRLTLVISGHVTDVTVALIDSLFGNVAVDAFEPVTLPVPPPAHTGIQYVGLDGAVQNTLRVGFRIPFMWDDIDYSHFMLLSTVLGGYFGSRLMSNLREDKGYTYGINSMTQIYRGSLAFHIVTDVAADKADAALSEIVKEMQRLCEQSVPEGELDMVRNCLLGDFMRSIDGVFERGERFCQMLTAGITEKFTDNLMTVLNPNAIEYATPHILQQLARSLFRPENYVIVSAGKVSSNRR